MCESAMFSVHRFVGLHNIVCQYACLVLRCEEDIMFQCVKVPCVCAEGCAPPLSPLSYPRVNNNNTGCRTLV